MTESPVAAYPRRIRLSACRLRRSRARRANGGSEKYSARSSKRDLDSDPAGAGRRTALPDRDAVRIRLREEAALRGQSHFPPFELPVDFESVGRELSVHSADVSVEVPEIVFRARPKPDEIQARVLDEQRIVGPRHEVDSAGETPAALEELQANRQAPALRLRMDGQEVRVLADPAVENSGKPVNEAEHSPPLERSGGQAARVRDRDQVRRGGRREARHPPRSPGDRLRGRKFRGLPQLAQEDARHARSRRRRARKSARRGRSSTSANS